MVFGFIFITKISEKLALITLLIKKKILLEKKLKDYQKTKSFMVHILVQK